ncbi:hypothetical protein NECID01_1719 [Nematocida sp. AWRm77]|nr:hypothetical protein NECID01_1719 [Nematocida sp. AWRm77]
MTTETDKDHFVFFSQIFQILSKKYPKYIQNTVDLAASSKNSSLSQSVVRSLRFAVRKSKSDRKPRSLQIYPLALLCRAMLLYYKSLASKEKRAVQKEFSEIYDFIRTRAVLCVYQKSQEFFENLMQRTFRVDKSILDPEKEEGAARKGSTPRTKYCIISGTEGIMSIPVEEMGNKQLLKEFEETEKCARRRTGVQYTGAWSVARELYSRTLGKSKGVPKDTEEMYFVFRLSKACRDLSPAILENGGIVGDLKELQRLYTQNVVRMFLFPEKTDKLPEQREAHVLEILKAAQRYSYVYLFEEMQAHARSIAEERAGKEAGVHARAVVDSLERAAEAVQKHVQYRRDVKRKPTLWDMLNIRERGLKTLDAGSSEDEEAYGASHEISRIGGVLLQEQAELEMFEVKEAEEQKLLGDAESAVLLCAQEWGALYAQVVPSAKVPPSPLQSVVLSSFHSLSRERARVEKPVAGTQSPEQVSAQPRKTIEVGKVEKEKASVHPQCEVSETPLADTHLKKGAGEGLDGPGRDKALGDLRKMFAGLKYTCFHSKDLSERVKVLLHEDAKMFSLAKGLFSEEFTLSLGKEPERVHRQTLYRSAHREVFGEAKTKMFIDEFRQDGQKVEEVLRYLKECAMEKTVQSARAKKEKEISTPSKAEKKGLVAKACRRIKKALSFWFGTKKKKITPEEKLKEWEKTYTEHLSKTISFTKYPSEGVALGFLRVAKALAETVSTSTGGVFRLSPSGVDLSERYAEYIEQNVHPDYEAIRKNTEEQKALSIVFNRYIRRFNGGVISGSLYTAVADRVKTIGKKDVDYSLGLILLSTLDPNTLWMLKHAVYAIDRVSQYVENNLMSYNNIVNMVAPNLLAADVPLTLDTPAIAIEMAHALFAVVRNVSFMEKPEESALAREI